MITLSTSGIYHQADTINYKIQLRSGGSGIGGWFLKNTLKPDINLLEDTGYYSYSLGPGIPFCAVGGTSVTYLERNVLLLGGTDWAVGFGATDNYVTWTTNNGTSESLPSGDYGYARFESSGIIKQCVQDTSIIDPLGSGQVGVTFYDDIFVMETLYDIVADENDAYAKLKPLCMFFNNDLFQGTETDDWFVGSGIGPFEKISDSSEDDETTDALFHIKKYTDFDLSGNPVSGQIDAISQWKEYPDPGTYDLSMAWAVNDGDDYGVFGWDSDVQSGGSEVIEGRYRCVTLFANGPSGLYDEEQLRIDWGFPDPIDGSTNAGQVLIGTKTSGIYGDYDNDGFSETMAAYLVQAEDGSGIQVEFNSKRGLDWANTSFFKPRIIVTSVSYDSGFYAELSTDDGSTWGEIPSSGYFWEVYRDDYIFGYLDDITGSGSSAPHIRLTWTKPVIVTDASGNFPIYAEGYALGSGNFPIYAFGAHLSSGSFSVYASGAAGVGSGDYPIYAGGFEDASSGNFPIYTYGHVRASGDFPIYVQADFSSGNFPIYAFGVEDFSSGNFPIFAHGYIKTSGSFSIYACGHEPASGIFPIYALGGLISSNSLWLYAHVADEAPSDDGFSIYAKVVGPSGSFPIYAAGSGATGTSASDSFSIYAHSVGVSNNFSIFAYNSSFSEAEVFSIYAKGREGPPPDFSIFVKAPDWTQTSGNFSIYGLGGYGFGAPADDNFPVFAYGRGLSDPSGDHPSEDGSIPTSGSFPIFVYSPGKDSSFAVYTYGYDAASGSFSIFAWSAEGASSGSVSLYTKGNIHVSKSLRIYTIGWWSY